MGWDLLAAGSEPLVCACNAGAGSSSPQENNIWCLKPPMATGARASAQRHRAADSGLAFQKVQ